MSQEYYQLKSTNYGSANIGVHVFENIIINEIDQIEDVTLASSKKLALISKEPITVVINDKNQVSVSVEITVGYGKNINSLTKTIQSKISDAFLNLMQIKYCKVNVIISAIDFE